MLDLRLEFTVNFKSKFNTNLDSIKIEQCCIYVALW
jgi:hypothetical protein